VVLIFLCDKRTLSCKNIIRILFKILIKILLGLVLESITDAFLTLNDLWDCTLLGTLVPQFAYWSIGSFLHESLSHSLLYFTTRIIRALPLSRYHCRISIAETQTCLQALSLLGAYNTIHTTHCIHFQWFRKKNYFESRILQILLTSERGRRSNITFITNILHVLPKKLNSNIFLQMNVFQRKKANKEPKGHTNFFRPTW